VNNRFTEITGYSADEVVGQNPRFLKSGETPAAVYERLWKTIIAGREWRGTIRNKRKDGSLYLAGLSIAPIRDLEGTLTHFLAAEQDITEKVENDLRLKHAEKMDALGNLAGGIAHDFNNLLLPIISLSNLVQKSLPREDGKNARRLEKVIEAGNSAKKLVGRILGFSRQEVMETGPLDIHATVERAMELIRATIPATIKIVGRLDAETGTVVADADQIASVLMNLMSNSTDAMNGKTGEIVVSLKPVEVDAVTAASIPNLKERRYAKIEVIDDGHGMNEKTQARCMDPFFTTKPVGEGTGLGLSTAHGIVTNLGGAIDISSRPGKGTTVTMYFPLAREQAAADEEKRFGKDSESVTKRTALH